MERFEKRKEDVLGKEDKSSIGELDLHIKKLCETINEEEDYYTTSSCSGRIIIMQDQEKKGPGLFEFVSHELVHFDEMWKKISKISKGNTMKGTNMGKENLKFKSEPPILHIACVDLESAEDLLNGAREAGWKRSGIISMGKNIIVEIISTEKLEFPLVKNGKLLINEEFFKIVIEKANKNLENGWKKIDKLWRMF